MKTRITAVLLILVFAFCAFSQTATVITENANLRGTPKQTGGEQSELFKTIMAKDGALFNVGFNTCDISRFETLLSEKFEFFHDKDGISDKKEFVYNLRNGLCKSPETYQSRRELVKGGTEIYPLYKKGVLYGAVQTGTHRFYETISGRPETFASIAKFTNLWLLEAGQWKLARSISYDHQAKQ